MDRQKDEWTTCIPSLPPEKDEIVRKCSMQGGWKNAHCAEMNDEGGQFETIWCFNSISIDSTTGWKAMF